MMNLKKLTPDEWWNKYESASQQEQYDLIKQSLEQKIFQQLAQEIDLVSIILEIFEDLMSEKDFDKVLELQSLLKDLPPEVLDNEKFYCDSFAIEVHLFKKNEEMVRESLNSFIEYPVRSIDTLIPIFDTLKYYGYVEHAEFLSREIYHEVRDSDELIGGAECDFAFTILMMEFQQLYVNKRKGIITDKKELLNGLKLYDYSDETQFDIYYEYLLADNNNFSNLTYKDFNENKDDFSLKLFIGFCKYVFECKNINFPTAYDIWCGAWEGSFLNNLNDKKDKGLDELFKLNKKAFYEYICSYFGFLSNKMSYGFAVLWGTQYVYDFLKLNHLINDKHYSEAQQYLKYTRMELIEGLKDSVWKYNFVHTWIKPDSCSDEEFEKEKEYFERTFLEKVSIKEYLTDEYIKRKTLKQKQKKRKVKL